MTSLISRLTILLSLVWSVSSVDQYSRNDFPPGFIFGSATSAYQVEGAANEDGRSPSIWDSFAHAGYMKGDNGDVACDGYHKYKEDVQLMANTGLDAYRFSISWSRIIPNGRGPVNPKGVEYYNNLIDELISHGIQPHVTLYNYDLPQVLEDEYGGWVNRVVVKDFKKYADVCFREFGDRVSHWTTLNEINIMAIGGYGQGIAPPARCSPPFGLHNCSRGNSSTEPYIVVHNMLLAHASAARLYEKKYKGEQNGSIGIGVYTFGMVPLTNSRNDKIATQRAKDFFLGWTVHPLIFGEYPDIMKKIVGSRLPSFTTQESRLVKGSSDFIGVIHYTTLFMEDNIAASELNERDFYADVGANLIFGGNSSLLRPAVVPSGLEQVLEYFKQNYGNPPVYILENGLATLSNSSLQDTSRIEYLHSYIGAMLDAVRNGSNTKGYFQWSFLDLFELLNGYESGYGLYFVDFNSPDLKRLPKLSAGWYSNFLKGMTVGSDGIIELKKNLSALSPGHFSQ